MVHTNKGLYSLKLNPWILEFCVKVGFDELETFRDLE